MEEWLRATMLDTAGISAEVSTRIYWGERPQGDPLPGIVLNLISDVPERLMSGTGNWHDARVQADCWAKTFGAATMARRAVAALDCLRATVDGKKYRVFVIDASSDPEKDAQGILHRARVDLRISYQS